MDCASELEIETDIASAKCTWLALQCALSSLALRWFYVTMWYLFHYAKIDNITMSWEKTLLYPQGLLQVYIKLPRCSSLYCWSNHILHLLHFGNRGGSPISSPLALGKLPHSRSSSPRHFMTHLWSFIPHGKKAYFALDSCSIYSYHFLPK